MLGQLPSFMWDYAKRISDCIWLVLDTESVEKDYVSYITIRDADAEKPRKRKSDHNMLRQQERGKWVPEAFSASHA